MTIPGVQSVCGMFIAAMPVDSSVAACRSRDSVEASLAYGVHEPDLGSDGAERLEGVDAR